MMQGFATKADNPANCSHALRTLMIYGEESWFNDVHNSYGLRFDTNPQIQHLIAQGLCRFGEYDHAIEHCRKAIVLGAGKPAEKLLEFCQNLLERVETGCDLDALKMQPKSARYAYVPLASIASSITLFIMLQGITALRSHTAWLVNGSLQQYTFTLDNEPYTLSPGKRQKIKMHLGKHELQIKESLPKYFTYTTSKLKQLILNELLVINPDAMALLTIDHELEPSHSHSKQIHTLSGIDNSMFDLSANSSAGKRVSFYRPKTHMEQVNRFHEIGLDEAAIAYARNALVMNPETAEVEPLLIHAIKGEDRDFITTFFRRNLAVSPALIPWHLYYQNYVMCTQSNHTLIEEYTARLKKYPNEPEASYLLGRLMSNPEVARKFFTFSEREEGMKGQGYHLIANDYFCRGLFQEALSYSDKTLNKNPGHVEFNVLHEQILLALRKYGELLNLENNLSNYSDEKKVLYLTCAGFHKEAEAAITSFSGASATRRSELNAIRFYAVGNMTDYVLALIETDHQTATFQQFMHQNNILEANRVLTADENHLWSDHLVLYCGAKISKLESIAQLHLNRAILELDQQYIYNIRMRSMLETEQAPTVEEIKTLQVSAIEKALLCATLGFRFPDIKNASSAESVGSMLPFYAPNP